MRSEPRVPITPRLVLGLFILGLGVLFLLDNLHLLRADEFLRYWPVLLIGVGLAKLIQPGASPSRVAGLLWVIAGVTLLAVKLNLISLRLRDVFPLLDRSAAMPVGLRTFPPSASGLRIQSITRGVPPAYINSPFGLKITS